MIWEPRRGGKPADLLAALYWAGVKAAAPWPALSAVLKEDGPASERVWIIALGKAAYPMAEAAAGHLREMGTEPVGGVIVGPDVAPELSPLTSFVGDHPLPGAGSKRAAEAIGDIAALTRSGDEVWVLLSGGATSLVAAPIEGIAAQDLRELYEMLLTSGLDIVNMNKIRKRFSRWGAGRLALALHPAQVRTFIVSDVIGDDIASIGSGPCAPDESTASDVRRLLEGAGLWSKVPSNFQEYLEAVERDPSLETPKGDDPALANVVSRIIVSNRLMLEAVAERARDLGLEPTLFQEPMTGEAAAAGVMVAQTISNQADPGTCLIWGGETVVKIEGEGGKGGRCQELALAASRELAAVAGRVSGNPAASGRAGGNPAPSGGPRGAPAAAGREDPAGAGGPIILAAGTDGRDGPTDAAGAIVDAATWEAVHKKGRDPDHDLATHDSHSALEAAGALFRTGPTGTNVMDLVIALRGTGGLGQP